jgi:cytochrome c553
MANIINIIKSFLFLVIVLSPKVYGGMIDTSNLAPWEICGLCHNLNGISPMAKFPKLAGQKPEYLKEQFIHFNTGERPNDGGQMQAITTEVKEGDIDVIAKYFSELSPPPASEEPIDEEIFTLGEELFLTGRENLPACTSCHSEEAHPAPWLYSQHADYLQKQLTDFIEGDRASEVMEGIAKQLQANEIEAISEYLVRTQPRK